MRITLVFVTAAAAVLLTACGKSTDDGKVDAMLRQAGPVSSIASGASAGGGKSFEDILKQAGEPKSLKK